MKSSDRNRYYSFRSKRAQKTAVRLNNSGSESEKVAANGGCGLEPSDVVSGGVPPNTSAGNCTKEAISPDGCRVDETEGRGSGRSPGTAEYEATRRLM